MDKQKLIARLQELPEEIEAAENKVLQENHLLIEAKRHLQNEESKAILNGDAEGKNEAQRRAKLNELLEDERKEVNDREVAYNTAKMQLNKKIHELNVLRSIALLLSGHANAVGLN